jgi:hypothetical protein
MEEEEAPAPRAPPTATEITDSLVDLLHAVCNVHQGTIGFGRKCRRETLASIVGWLDAHYSCVPTSAEMALLLACRVVLALECKDLERERDAATGVTAFLQRCGTPM